ncbi:MAG TPA: molybdopterin-dependent oxidoreductase [Desulfobacteraceae bacterium]|nr:molybdopterin-dependent oxidoreductase [Desulfobacteraceae bacterium]
MNKSAMKKNILVLVLVLLPLALPGSVVSKSGVTIVSSLGKGMKQSPVDLGTMKTRGQTITTTDPNFQSLGRAAYQGIAIKELLDLAHVPREKGVTTLGSDQYIGFISPEQIEQEQVILAWLINGETISPLEGGPLKIIFHSDDNVHGSNYTWYVNTFFAGRIKNPVLTVKAGTKERPLSFDSLAKHARTLDRHLFSLPSGNRDDYPGAMGTVKAVPLGKIVSMAGETIHSSVSLIPFAGKTITLSAETVTNFPVFIVVGMDQKPLHPVHGGPFSVVFPTEDHPGLAGRVPENGALFFLERITIR